MSGVDPVPGLDQVTLVGVDLDGMVHFMHSLLSVWVKIYSTIQRLFAFLSKLPAEGLPPVVETPHKAETFAARRSIRAVLRVDHVTHLGWMSPPNWQTKPCKRAGKMAGTDYCDLSCQGLNLAPPDCAA